MAHVLKFQACASFLVVYVFGGYCRLSISLGIGVCVWGILSLCSLCVLDVLILFMWPWFMLSADSIFNMCLLQWMQNASWWFYIWTCKSQLVYIKNSFFVACVSLYQKCVLVLCRPLFEVCDRLQVKTCEGACVSQLLCLTFSLLIVGILCIFF